MYNEQYTSNKRRSTDEKQSIVMYEVEPQPKCLKRTAAYCRVSTIEENQELSYETQYEFYKNLIENNPRMEFVDIYGDQGFSGLESKKRKEFQRMIADCEKGKIDLILVKSISRFSRNVQECLAYLEKLKEYGVEVFFEKEGLTSTDSKCQFILTIYASLAQNESCSISENLRWSIKRHAENGTPIRAACYGFHLIRDQKNKKSEWKIVEEEADRIRLIFKLAYQGYSMLEIRQQLNQYEAEVGSADHWTSDRIQDALRREEYRGDILTNKRVVLDYVNKKCIRNKGQVAQYYVEQHHDAIVDPEVFDAVQEYRKKGYLTAKNTCIRAKWFKEHPEILKRRS